jgi:hypothetical protein
MNYRYLFFFAVLSLSAIVILTLAAWRRPHRLLILLAAFGMNASAQTWSPILNSSRAINWGNAGTTSGIPMRTTICKTESPGVTNAQINTDIAACPSGDVLYLNAGTYNLAGGIVMKSGVTLRGAGANSTFIVFTGDTACNGEGADICMMGENTSSGSPWTQPGGSQAGTWSGGYSQGTTQITLTGVGSAGLSVGQYIYLDQSDLNADNGNFFVCDNTSTPCSLEGGAPGRNIGGTDYNQVQIVKITGISGNIYTITPGLYGLNWSSSLNPGAWWPASQMTGAGIENLSMDHTNGGGESGIMFYNAFDSWVSGVRSLNANRNHIWLWQSAHITVQNSYFYGTENAASQSYGVESFISSDNLVMNNIFQHITASLMMGPAMGSVFVYNFGVNDYYYVADYIQQMIFMGHDAGAEYNLFEGNEGTGFDGDVFHGTSGLNTVFRTRASGWEPGKTNGTATVELMAYTRDDNFIGNVLGQPGYDTAYQTQLGAGTGATIYDLGAGDSEGSVVVPNDSLVASTLMRWGNYDTFKNSTQWNNAEVPSTTTSYANSVPTTETLPASFWLSSTPSWWPSGKPWPPIGPDVASGNMGLCSGGSFAGMGATSSSQCGSGGTLASAYAGHVNTIPAMDCYLSTMSGPPDGSGSALSFNASQCYSPSGTTTTGPASPTTLTGTPVVLQ